MSQPKIGTNVTLSGEKEYRAALAEIDSALRVLKSDMQLLSAAFDGNENSVEALRAVNERLNQQILTQQEKVDTLQEALEFTAETYGVASTKTQGYQASLAKAQAELIEMEKALRENTQALESAGGEADNFSGGLEDLEHRTSQWTDSAENASEALDRLEQGEKDAEKSSGKLSDAVGKVADALGVKLPDGTGKAIDKLGDLDPKLVALAGGFAAVVTAIVKVEKALADMTLEAAESAAKIQNLSQTIGMSTESAQKWDYVLKTVGSSLEDAQGDLSNFLEKVRDAENGNEDAILLFEDLGVALRDDVSGNLRTTEDLLYDVIDALREMDDQTQRNALSSEALGSTGEKLIPIYNQTREELDALMQRKEELGILDEEELQLLAKVKTAQLDANEAMESGSNAIAEKFAPALERFITRSGESVGELEQALADSGLIEVFASVLDLVTALTPALGALGDLTEACEPIFRAAALTISAVADAVDAVFTSVEALVQLLGGDASGAWDTLKSGLSDIPTSGATQRVISAAKESASTPSWLIGYGASHSSGKFASGTDFFPGGRTLLSENGPEMAILPQGTRIMTAQETREATGGDTYYVTIEARTIKEIDDIARMAKEKRRTERMG